MNATKKTVMPSTRASSRAAAASLTKSAKEDTAPAAAPETAENAGGVDPILAKLRRPKKEVVKPRQFRIPESLFEQVDDACEQLGCTYSDFARAAFETLLGKLRTEGEIN